ncbi:MAG: Hsp33 family molecular chaperone [Hyphomicrobium sp. 32-62-53]|nr:MAG: Hsp33 family molecular chaperone [Hyphomicrobium sp. 12-62-95]OYY00172.1 MAG: Hsp33 family molecular chaperone [Hyphomicrobium sp. 32-62-53]
MAGSETRSGKSPGLQVQGADDLVLPFSTDKSGIRGRVVRMGGVVDTILSRHDYPEAVSEALGQALALTAMLGQPLKPGGRLGFQTRTDGPIRFLLADYEAPGRLRGYASFDAEAIAAKGPRPKQGDLIGSGHMAMTLERVGEDDRYQGIVALDGQSLQAAALTYFRQSEQLPSYVRLAVARHRVQGGDGWHWRAGGLLIQHPTAQVEDNDSPSAPPEQENWQRARILAASVEDHELIDPTLSAERLLFRLFNEEDVRVFKGQPLDATCRCSRERVQMFLTRFPDEDLDGLREPDGSISVTCEFCNSKYVF